MFDNIGEKIKGLAKLCFGLCLFLGIVLGIVAGIAAKGFAGFLLFLVISVVSGVVGYLSVMILYAFGDLVANTEHIRRYVFKISNGEIVNERVSVGQVTYPVRTNSGKSNLESVANSMNNEGEWRCSNCDLKNAKDAKFCRGCGKVKGYTKEVVTDNNTTFVDSIK